MSELALAFLSLANDKFRNGIMENIPRHCVDILHRTKRALAAPLTRFMPLKTIKSPRHPRVIRSHRLIAVFNFELCNQQIHSIKLSHRQTLVRRFPAPASIENRPFAKHRRVKRPSENAIRERMNGKTRYVSTLGLSDRKCMSWRTDAAQCRRCCRCHRCI